MIGPSIACLLEQIITVSHAAGFGLFCITHSFEKIMTIGQNFIHVIVVLLNSADYSFQLIPVWASRHILVLVTASRLLNTEISRRTALRKTKASFRDIGAFFIIW
jgi:hypothetical protein